MPSQTLFVESENDKKKIEIVISSNVTKDTQQQAPAIIIAHPYGPLGGNMRNNVVIAVQKYFESQGYITVCLNFRGCGRSEGRTSWTGMPERQDYISVMNFLLRNENQALNLPTINHLILCGYSFGAMIASSIQCTQLPYSYLLISIPLGVMWALATTKATFFKQKPTIEPKDILCIYGDRDQFTGVKSVKNWYVHGICIEGADHFWFDFEEPLIDHIDRWQKTLLTKQ